MLYCILNLKPIYSFYTENVSMKSNQYKETFPFHMHTSLLASLLYLYICVCVCVDDDGMRVSCEFLECAIHSIPSLFFPIPNERSRKKTKQQQQRLPSGQTLALDRTYCLFYLAFKLYMMCFWTQVHFCQIVIYRNFLLINLN